MVRVTAYAPAPRLREFREKASSPATAASRAIRKAKSEFGRKRIDTWQVTILPL